jgi:hypothetical protein
MANATADINAIAAINILFPGESAIKGSMSLRIPSGMVSGLFLSATFSE